MRRRKNGHPRRCRNQPGIHGAAAGQSFGAFLAEGVTLKLNGEANDYVGKGLSGGTIAIGRGVAASRRGDVLAGNTVLYGRNVCQLFVAGRRAGSVSLSETAARLP